MSDCRRVGQAVVCIDNTIGDEVRHLVDLTKFMIPQCGPVYTIRSIVERDGFIGLRLHGIINPVWGPDEAWFDSEHFRPVVESDISVFTAILDRLPKREVVDA